MLKIDNSKRRENIFKLYAPKSTETPSNQFKAYQERIMQAIRDRKIDGLKSKIKRVDTINGIIAFISIIFYTIEVLLLLNESMSFCSETMLRKANLSRSFPKVE